MDRSSLDTCIVSRAQDVRLALEAILRWIQLPLLKQVEIILQVA